MSVYSALERDEARIGEVIKRASAECVVTDISEVSDGALPALAKHERFPATFDNISHYVNTVGGLDANVATVLTAAGSIAEISEADEEAKTTLATAILAARDALPSAGLRVKLVASLKLNVKLGADDIEVEKGELFALLLKYDIIADDAASFAHLADTDWPTREAFIRASAKFKEYVTPAHVQGDLAALLLSEKIDRAIKTEIVERASEFVEGAGREGLSQLAGFATQYKHELSQEVVQKMALGGVPAQYVVCVIQPHLGLLARDQLFSILQSLGGDYPGLTSVGRDRPRIPNTAADRALVEELKKRGTVSTYEVQASHLRVNKKHK